MLAFCCGTFHLKSMLKWEKIRNRRLLDSAWSSGFILWAGNSKWYFYSGTLHRFLHGISFYPNSFSTNKAFTNVIIRSWFCLLSLRLCFCPFWMHRRSGSCVISSLGLQVFECLCSLRIFDTRLMRLKSFSDFFWYSALGRRLRSVRLKDKFDHVGNKYFIILLRKKNSNGWTDRTYTLHDFTSSPAQSFFLGNTF